MNLLSKVIRNDDMQNITVEFARLKDRCYLENAGATLYPKSLIKIVNEDLMQNIYMNPHTDKYTKDCIEQIRCLILRHFNTDPTTYSVVFTSGTTQSLKLVAESFQFASEQNESLNSGSFVYLRDNHTSVLGLREIAADRNADVVHLSHQEFLNSLCGDVVTTTKFKGKYKNKGNTLLVYPAQSNFNGFKYPLEAIDNIKNGYLNQYMKKHLGKVSNNWYVLLDAASYVATNKLDLGKMQPDFICFSFYKIFGYPTGLGALLIKNSSAKVLNQKRYFGGGTVDVVLTSEDFHVKRETLHERFEDGTVPFLSIIALKHCFDVLHTMIPKIINSDVMDTISHHTFFLAQDLYYQLNKLEHGNGVKAAVVYADTDFVDIEMQGAIVTFNLMRDDKSFVGYAEFQNLADLFSINVRTGCFCNSGSCQRHLKATNKEMKEMYKAGHKCGDDFDLINGRPTGAIRASFGYYNTYDDVDKLIQMICRCFVATKLKKPKRTVYNQYEKRKLSNISNPIQQTPTDSSLDVFSDQKYLRMFNSNQGQKSPQITPTSNDIVLTEIAIFPIKSCGAFKIRTAWKIGPKGFDFDREWMIVKDNGVCLTQKQNPSMCMICPKIDLKEKVLILTFKGKSPITVPLEPKMDSPQKPATLCHTKVCSDFINGVDCGDEVANWISEALEVSYLRLIRQSETDKRMQKKKKEEEKKLLSLSNQAQFLLINRTTVKWLRDQIKDPTFTDDLDQLTNRFRGNLMIDTEHALVEREWERLIIGKHEFKVEGLCPRCHMVCIDQQTGEKTVEPLRTISEQFGGKIRFGIYMTYVGTVDGSKDCFLKNYASMKPITAVEDISRSSFISRLKDWFYVYFLSYCLYPRKTDKNNFNRNKCTETKGGCIIQNLYKYKIAEPKTKSEI